MKSKILAFAIILFLSMSTLCFAQPSEYVIKKKITQLVIEENTFYRDLLKAGFKVKISIDLIGDCDIVDNYYPVFADVLFYDPPYGKGSIIGVGDYEYFKFYEEETGYWRIEGVPFHL